MELAGCLAPMDNPLRRSLSGLWLVACALLLACAAGGGLPAVSPEEVECGEIVDFTSQTSLPPEIDAVIELRCRKCHGQPLQYFAPMPLMTWEDFHAASVTYPMEPVYSVVARRIDAQNRTPMPPVREPPLQVTERALLEAWLDECAPPHDP